jgi:hypothetical protein
MGGRFACGESSDYCAYKEFLLVDRIVKCP